MFLFILSKGSQSIIGKHARKCEQTWVSFYFNSLAKQLIGDKSIKLPEIALGRPEKRYKAASGSSDFLANGFRNVMVTCGWAPLLGPTAYILYQYFNGTLTDDMIKAPIPAT